MTDRTPAIAPKTKAQARIVRHLRVAGRSNRIRLDSSRSPGDDIVSRVATEAGDGRSFASGRWRAPAGRAQLAGSSGKGRAVRPARNAGATIALNTWSVSVN